MALMARILRIVIPGCPHHVTQRGNRNMPLFHTDTDRRVFLSMLGKYANKHGLAIWAYCLMTNHVHLIAVPQAPASLPRTMRDGNSAYAAYLNRTETATGHVWQGRYYSCPTDDAHLWAAVRYIERNPVRAGMVARAEDYAWSSAQAHCAMRDNALLTGGFPPPGAIDDWKAWLSDEDPRATELIRHQTRLGRPCGSVGFVEMIESLLARRVQPGKRGRRPGCPRS